MALAMAFPSARLPSESALTAIGRPLASSFALRTIGGFRLLLSASTWRGYRGAKRRERHESCQVCNLLCIDRANCLRVSCAAPSVPYSDILPGGGVGIARRSQCYQLSVADPYRHQESQFEYYEPAYLHRPTMSGRWPLAVFILLDVGYGVGLCYNYLPNGVAFFAVQAALYAFIWWARRP